MTCGKNQKCIYDKGDRDTVRVGFYLLFDGVEVTMSGGVIESADNHVLPSRPSLLQQNITKRNDGRIQ